MLRWLSCLILALLSSLPAAAEEKIDFNRDIRPILSENCFQCHGPDKGQRKAGLRLDQRDSVLKKKALVPGKPEQSELVARLVSKDTTVLMPPPDSNRHLKPAQIELIRKWIAQGGEYQGHWAYQAPVKPTIPPRVNAIDHLVQAHLARLKLTPSPEADRRTLIRRLTFDLIGLPPTPAEVEAFVKDTSPDAYARVVERLLASPHFGERMAQGWLDVVRFADTIGYHSDNPRNVWPYRDWVIKSFNDNKRFDQFTIEQLAGDLLENPTQDQKVGSAFNRLLLTTEEGGAQAKDYEARMLGDRVRAVGTVWLGQTIGCCQCHDHKFDPLTMHDFYAMGAFFADIQEPILGRREPGMVVANDEAVKKLAELEAAVAEARKALDADKNNAEKKAAFDRANKAKAAYDATLPRCLISISMKTPRTVRILPRGNWLDNSGDIVQPALPSFFASDMAEPKTRLTRLDLAKWIVARDNPLTARVFVNRLWKQFFGLGLSRVLDDLGSQGEPPVHPELLDWLAVEFQDSGWDVKHVIRTIVQSQTYRQSSKATPEALARDPENRDLARQSRWRLDAEQVRDSALAIGGLLNMTLGGPSVHPYQPDGYWENLNFPTRSWPTDNGPKQYRRGLYTWWQRTFPHPSMLAFDAPSREECTAERNRSNIPQQALVLLNDPTYVEAARTFAARVIQEAGDPNKRIARAFQLALQREPTPVEMELLTQLQAETRKKYDADRKAAESLLKVGQSPIPAGMDPVDLATFTSVTRALLNLHETITRN
jgi:mono/diheme cytochrome c family protein